MFFGLINTEGLITFITYHMLMQIEGHALLKYSNRT